jgi:uncharacterized protein involved in cysteine biosynthesis
MSTQNVTVVATSTFTQLAGTVTKTGYTESVGLPLLVPIVIFAILIAFLVARNRRKVFQSSKPLNRHATQLL